MSDIVLQRGPRRDVVWEELERLFGKVTNQNTRGRRNRVCKLIRESLTQMAIDEPDNFPRDDDAVQREVRSRHARFTQLWPGVKPTDTALANRWDDCNPRWSQPDQTGPVALGPPPAPAEVARTYIDQMRERGWVKSGGEVPEETD